MKNKISFVLLNFALGVALFLRFAKVLPNFETITFAIVYVMNVFYEESVPKKYVAVFIAIILAILSILAPALNLLNLIPVFSFLAVILLSRVIKGKILLPKTLFSVVVFFIVSNFLFFLIEPFGMYAKNISGLISCYIQALPFVKNQFLSNMLIALVYDFILARAIERSCISEKAGVQKG